MERANGSGSGDVYLIGCSRSVLDLTDEERARINRSRFVLGMNKFVYFHKIAGIVPTHVWFAEDHDPTPRILDDIFAYCRRERMRGLTFVLGSLFRRRVRAGALRYNLARVRRKLRWDRSRNWSLMHAPAGCSYEYVTRNDWMEGGRWATRLDEPMYHLRTAFTAALNYLAVRHPGGTIRLVGTDFNTGGYFFGDEMKRQGLAWDDWTTAVQAEQGKHTAAIEYGGRTVFDGFPYMKDQLDRAGIRLVCNNPTSETVLRGLATYAPILEGKAEAVG